MDTSSLGRFTAQVRLKNTSAEHEFTLMSLPQYLAGQVGRIVGSCFKEGAESCGLADGVG